MLRWRFCNIWCRQCQRYRRLSLHQMSPHTQWMIKQLSQEKNRDKAQASDEWNPVIQFTFWEKPYERQCRIKLDSCLKFIFIFISEKMTSMHGSLAVIGWFPSRINLICDWKKKKKKIDIIFEDDNEMQRNRQRIFITSKVRLGIYLLSERVLKWGEKRNSVTTLLYFSFSLY